MSRGGREQVGEGDGRGRRGSRRTRREPQPNRREAQSPQRLDRDAQPDRGVRERRARPNARRTAQPEAQLIWSRPEPGARRTRLTRDEIAAAALAIADAEGIDALSMRRVAAALGVGTMSLYYYVSTKEELLTLMHDKMLSEVVLAEDELPAHWRGALEAIARSSRNALRRHRWSIDAPPTVPGPNGLRHFDQSLAAVADLPIDFATQFEIITLVDEYVFGFVLHEAQEQREREEQGDAIREAIADYFESRMRSGELPHIERLVAGEDARAVIDRLERLAGDEQRFDRGLRRILDGVEAELERAKRAR